MVNVSTNKNTNKTMETSHKLQILAAKQAKEVAVLAENLGIKFPWDILMFINDTQHETEYIPNDILQTAFKLRTLTQIYAYIFGYIDVDTLLTAYKENKAYEKKYWYGEEYYGAPKYDMSGIHLSIRPSRLLPMY